MSAQPTSRTAVTLVGAAWLCLLPVTAHAADLTVTPKGSLRLNQPAGFAVDGAQPGDTVVIMLRESTAPMAQLFGHAVVPATGETVVYGILNADSFGLETGSRLEAKAAVLGTSLRSDPTTFDTRAGQGFYQGYFDGQDICDLVYAPAYVMHAIDAGPFADGSRVNDWGAVVGNTTLSTGGQQGYVALNGQVTLLEPLAQDYSAAADLNNFDEIAGTSETNELRPDGFGYVRHATFWSDGIPADLGTLCPGQPTESQGLGINEKGWVVGSSDNCAGVERAVLFRNNQVTPLGTLGGTTSVARDVSNGGFIVGMSHNVEHKARAFLFDEGVMTDLGTLGGDRSEAFGVNNRREVVGNSQLPSMDGAPGARRAFRWYDGEMTDLGTLPGGNWSGAWGINDAGDIVGWSTNGEGKLRPVLWRDLQIHELHGVKDVGEVSEGWATDLSNGGFMSGSAVVDDGVTVSQVGFRGRWLP